MKTLFELLRGFFKKQIIASQAVDYLTVYFKYHINTCDKQCLVFDKNDIKLLLINRFPNISYNTIEHVIKVSLQFITSDANVKKFTTDDAIYLNVN